MNKNPLQIRTELDDRMAVNLVLNREEQSIRLSPFEMELVRNRLLDIEVWEKDIHQSHGFNDNKDNTRRIENLSIMLWGLIEMAKRQGSPLLDDLVSLRNLTMPPKREVR